MIVYKEIISLSLLISLYSEKLLGNKHKRMIEKINSVLDFYTTKVSDLDLIKIKNIFIELKAFMDKHHIDFYPKLVDIFSCQICEYYVLNSVGIRKIYWDKLCDFIINESKINENNSGLNILEESSIIFDRYLELVDNL